MRLYGLGYSMAGCRYYCNNACIPLVEIGWIARTSGVDPNSGTGLQGKISNHLGKNTVSRLFLVPVCEMLGRGCNMSGRECGWF